MVEDEKTRATEVQSIVRERIGVDLFRSLYKMRNGGKPPDTGKRVETAIVIGTARAGGGFIPITQTFWTP